jgi:hypothetical protein
MTQLKAMSGGEITASRRLNRKGVLIREKKKHCEYHYEQKHQAITESR